MDLLHVAVAVFDLVDDIVLQRHQLQLVCHVLHRAEKLRHVLVQVESEERRLEHRLVQHLLWLEVKLWPLVSVLHQLVGQLLDLLCLGVDPLVVKKFAQRVENGELKVFSVHLSIRLLFDHWRRCTSAFDHRRLLLLFLTAQCGLQIALVVVITTCHGHSRSSSPLWRCCIGCTPIVVPLLMLDLLVARRAKLQCHDRIPQVSLGLRPYLH